MKVLIVASYNNRRFAPFIVEQAEALKREGVDINYFGIQGKGYKGYIRAYPELKRKIDEWRPDIIHAHYGLSGLMANFQRKVPVVTTYHGSDINQKRVLPFSKLCMALSRFNIFVSSKTLNIAKPRSRYSLIPCGVNISELQLMGKEEALQELHLDADKKYVLFAGAFDNTVKNATLAKSAIKLIPNADLIELKGLSRENVTKLMCAADCFLMTSLSEGSPQVIKEAMACGCPIVSVDVGDVKYNLTGVDGCHIVPRDPQIIASTIKAVLAKNKRISGKARLIELDLANDLVATKLLRIYNNI